MNYFPKTLKIHTSLLHVFLLELFLVPLQLGGQLAGFGVELLNLVDVGLSVHFDCLSGEKREETGLLR